MKTKIKNLIDKIDSIKASQNIEEDFDKFLIELQTLEKESVTEFKDSNLNDRELIYQISSLINYRPFQQLNSFEKFFTHWFYRGPYPLDTSNHHLYDLDTIQLRLKAILFKLSE